LTPALWATDLIAFSKFTFSGLIRSGEGTTVLIEFKMIVLGAGTAGSETSRDAGMATVEPPVSG
jgi:hypothetical protein